MSKNKKDDEKREEAIARCIDFGVRYGMFLVGMAIILLLASYGGSE